MGNTRDMCHTVDQTRSAGDTTPEFRTGGVDEPVNNWEKADVDE